jgi:hypothetical protein
MKIINCKRILFEGFLAFFLVIILFSCRPDDPVTEVKPLLRTNDVEADYSGGEILFSGEFVLSGIYSTIEYGFEISTNTTFNNSVLILAGNNKQPGKFNFSSHNAITPGCFIRAWANTSKYQVYGNVVEVTKIISPKPLIEKVFPEKAMWGDTLMITGKYFSYFSGENQVLFNKEIAKTWTSQDTIYAIVPVVAIEKELDLQINVEVKGNRTEKYYPFSLSTPKVLGINKTDGQYPDTIVVSGEDFTDFNSWVVFDGKPVEIFDVTKKSFSFIVPYIKEEKFVKIELSSFKRSYPITDNFKYHGQGFLNFSVQSAWLTDTLKLYSKNTDFGKILLNLKNGDHTLNVLHKWKDSLEFILDGDYRLTKFNLEIQFGRKTESYPFTSFETMDRAELMHRDPLLISLDENELVYLEPIKWLGKGIYPYLLSQGVLLKSLDGTFETTSSNFNYLSSDLLVPGEYQLQLIRFDKLSNPLYFTVKAPVIESVTPTSFTRDDKVQVQGKYLPLYNKLTFTHIQSGRKFDLNSYGSSTSQSPYAIDLVGDGDYQIGINIGDKYYKCSCNIKNNDSFYYLLKLQQPTDFIDFVKSSFVVDNKMYICHQGGITIVDITNGNVRKIAGDYQNLEQPIILNNTVYMYLRKEHGYVLCSFDKVNEVWNEVNTTGLPEFDYYKFGVLNNHLIAYVNKEIYQLDQDWNLLGKVQDPNGNFSYVDHIYSKNGYIYFFNLYTMEITVISTQEWKVVKTIKLGDSYYNCHFFEKDGHLIYWGPTTNGQDIILKKFNADTETIENLNPKRMNGDYSYYYNVFSTDGKGNIFFLSQNYLYKFNPR